VIEVVYKAEDLANVDGGDAAETHRVLRGAPIMGRYPKRIKYAPAIIVYLDRLVSPKACL
jgi:hypothetical protein